MTPPLALVTFPVHDWPWVQCAGCDGRSYRDECPYGRIGNSRCCGACDVDVCACVEDGHPGIEPWPEDDATLALLPPGAFACHPRPLVAVDTLVEDLF